LGSVEVPRRTSGVWAKLEPAKASKAATLNTKLRIPAPELL
jgi:hypothetical protein